MSRAVFVLSFAVLVALVSGVSELAAQSTTNRADLFDQRSQMAEQQDKLQKKQLSSQRDRVPLDGVIDRTQYPMGPGDEVEISIWGGEKYDSYNLFVSAEGRLLLPSVGPVEVGGLSVDRAEQVLREKASIIYTDARLTMSLVNPRLFRAFVLGGVFDPGTYYMSAVDRVSDLVNEGGGLKPEASRRRIRLLDRERNLVDTVDLLSYNANGDVSKNPRLADGYTVEIPAMGQHVVLRGQFLNLSGTDSIKVNDYLKEESRLYRVEFLPGESLKDLLKLVGMPPSVDTSSVRTVVVGQGKDRRVLKLDDPEFESPLAAGLMFEFPVRTQWVYVSGSVTRGGRFLYQPGYTVNDYLGQAGGPNYLGSDNTCFVTRADGTREKIGSTAAIGPGDMIYVPGRVQWLDRMIGPLIGLLGVFIAVTAK